MAAERVDTLAKSLSAGGTRRRLLGLMTALPLAGGLAKILEQEGAANRPGQNRRAHNHRHSGHRKNKRQDQKEDEDDNDNRGGSEPAYCATTLTQAGCAKKSDGTSIVWMCPFNTHLEGANLSNCNLIGAHFEGCFLKGARFDNAILNNSHFESAQAEATSFVHATMIQAKFILTNLGTVSDFQYADAREADFTRASLNTAGCITRFSQGRSCKTPICGTSVGHRVNRIHDALTVLRPVSSIQTAAAI